MSFESKSWYCDKPCLVSVHKRNVGSKIEGEFKGGHGVHIMKGLKIPVSIRETVLQLNHWSIKSDMCCHVCMRLVMNP